MEKQKKRWLNLLDQSSKENLAETPNLATYGSTVLWRHIASFGIFVSARLAGRHHGRRNISEPPAPFSPFALTNHAAVPFNAAKLSNVLCFSLCVHRVFGFCRLFFFHVGRMSA